MGGTCPDGGRAAVTYTLQKARRSHEDNSHRRLFSRRRCCPLGGPHPRLADFKELRDYSSWQEVTAGPHKVLPKTWSLCMAPAPPGWELPIPARSRPREGPVHPRLRHSHTARSCAASRVERYPEGSAVAKVKLVEGSSEPVAVAFMVKGKPGSNPEGRDWEYSSSRASRC